MPTESNARLAVSLPRFDGPFELLLGLIRRNEYSMDQLPITAITGQFLGYIRAAEALDMELGAEFIDTASWLVLLKSRSMLPREAPAEAQNELREAVQRYQLDRETLDQTRKKLGGLRSKRERVATAGAARGRRVEEIDEEPAPTAADVVKRVRSAIATARAASSFNTDEASATVAEQKAWVLSNTGQFSAGTPFSAEPWFAAQSDIAARISLFLALLELARTRDVLLYQRRDFGAILMKRLLKEEGHQQETVDALSV